MEQKKIAVFDFDGTITDKDSLIEFLKFTQGYVKLGWGLFVLSPVLALYLLKIIPNYKAKQLLFSWFYRGWDIEKFNAKCLDFIPVLNQTIRPAALMAIRNYQAQNIPVIAITASVENWVLPWARANGINEVIGTQIAVDSHNHITGRFSTKNCYGQEKVNRLLEQYPNRNTYVLEAYGDSDGDKELLAFADVGYLRKFNKL